MRTNNISGFIKSLLRKVLENSFAEKGIPVFVPSNDDSGIVDNLAANKVVFSTYHQAKGLERKVVVVFGFNADYFTYFAKESDSLRCPVRTVNMNNSKYNYCLPAHLSSWFVLLLLDLLLVLLLDLLLFLLLDLLLVID